MPTQTQKDQIAKRLKEYAKRYLSKKYETLDESATRLMINSFLTEVLGYAELDEIKTEYQINNTYADYIIQVQRKKYIIVEVKAIQIDLSDKHIYQSINYAANEGVDWVLLTNGRVFSLYRVVFKKPITHKRICSFDLKDKAQLKQSIEYFAMMTKRSMLKNELDDFWLRFQALEPNNLCKYLYSTEVGNLLRRALKKKAGLTFSDEDIFASIYQIIVEKIAFEQPGVPNTIFKRQKIKPELVTQHNNVVVGRSE
ncbi:MAG: type I restriction enzyme HsdR N-terminal domain-containing protein [Patescibacteria group bacterium]|jgi:predicted type IV restriction endonuclease